MNNTNTSSTIKLSPLIYKLAERCYTEIYNKEVVAILHDLLIDEGQDQLAKWLRKCMDTSLCRGHRCHVVVCLNHSMSVEETLKYTTEKGHAE